MCDLVVVEIFEEEEEEEEEEVAAILQKIVQIAELGQAY